MDELHYTEGEKTTIWNNKNGVSYVTFKQLDDLGLRHGFSTRIGGVSEGFLSSMNLSFQRGDKEEAVYENHRRFAQAIGYDEKKLVFSDQVHSTYIGCVTEQDCGSGIVRENEHKEADGLVTNAKNVPLITFYADCVPLFFYDAVKQVVALAHSGWKGTVAGIGEKMVQTMADKYGCQPNNIYAAIGPSICQNCYEISDDVARAFKERFSKEEFRHFAIEKENGKYQLDLWKANQYVLLRSSIRKENLSITNLCTCCNPEVFFSHRASKGKRGSLAAVIMLS